MYIYICVCVCVVCVCINTNNKTIINTIRCIHIAELEKKHEKTGSNHLVCKLANLMLNQMLPQSVPESRPMEQWHWKRCPHCLSRKIPRLIRLWQLLQVPIIVTVTAVPENLLLAKKGLQTFGQTESNFGYECEATKKRLD